MFKNQYFSKFSLLHPLPPLKIENFKIAKSNFLVLKFSHPMCNFIIVRCYRAELCSKNQRFQNSAFPLLKIENSKIAKNNFLVITLSWLAVQFRHREIIWHQVMFELCWCQPPENSAFFPLPPLKTENSNNAENYFLVFKSSLPMCNFVIDNLAPSHARKCVFDVFPS